ncbi:hypothetical protein Tsp_01204, partial [Trichinella spiralis]
MVTVLSKLQAQIYTVIDLEFSANSKLFCNDEPKFNCCKLPIYPKTLHML